MKRITPELLLRFLVCFGIVVVLIKFAGGFYFYYQRPTLPWRVLNVIKHLHLDLLFSAGLLLLVCLCAFTIGLTLWRMSETRYMTHWMVIASSPLFLFAVYASSLHREIVVLFRSVYDHFGFAMSSVFLLVIAVLMLAACFKLFYGFLLSFERKNRILLGTAIGVALVGGVLLEGISEKAWHVNEGHTLAYLVIDALEITFELTGLILLVHTFHRHLDSLKQTPANKFLNIGDAP